MQFTLIDAAGTLLAALICAPVVVLPGFALAGVVKPLGFWTRGPASQLQLALIAAFAFLPALDSLALRFIGLWPAVALNLILAVLGGRVLLQTGLIAQISPRAWRIAALAAALLFALAGYAIWDLDWAGRLYISIIDTDMVKHAATIQGLLDHGASIPDPFFARPGGSGYYYYFYSPGALVEALGFGLMDARAAFSGLMIWTAVALYALVCEVMERCGYAHESQGGMARYRPLLVGLMLVAGLDILPVTLMGAAGIWAPTLGAWSEEVTPWLVSLLWVPHHLTSFIAIWTGVLLLSAAIEAKATRPFDLSMAAAMAGLAFASAFGASVWVTLAGVATIVLWLITLAWGRRWPAVRTVLAAGLVAGLLSLPQLHDLLAYRQDHASPIALTVRAFKMFDGVVTDPVPQYVGRALLLPLNYGLEFGVFALGAVLFLRRAGPGDVWGRPVPRLLALSAVAGLLLGTFAKSTIIYNDLGWRVMLFPQLAALIWTAVELRHFIEQRRAEPSKHADLLVVWSLLIVLGVLTNFYALFGLRFYQLLTPPKTFYTAPRDLVIRHDLRTAFGWMNRRLPLQAVVQQSPAPFRVMEFGLYGRNRVGVADVEAMLFGASKAEAGRRLQVLTPIFQTAMPAAEAGRRAQAEGVDDLIATAKDPAWASRASWVWAAPPLYASPNVRVIAVSSLSAIRPPAAHP